MNNYGKKFESKFKDDFLKIKGADLIRLRDVTMGYKKIKNVADFICYIYPYTFYLDCKSLEGNTFNFSKLTQWDEMSQHIGIKGVNVGAIIWFINHNKVCFVPIEEFIRLKKLDYKSIHVNMVGNPEFNVYELPGVPKRVFIDTDYSKLIDIADIKAKNALVGDVL